MKKTFRKRCSAKKNNKSRKSTKYPHNKRRKFTKKINKKNNKRRIIKGGGLFSNLMGNSNNKLKNLREIYDPLMKLFNKVLDAKYEDTICDLNLGSCAWVYPFHTTDQPELERLSNEFTELYKWTTENNPLNLSAEEMNKATQMKNDIEQKFEGAAYNLLRSKDKKNASAGYPAYDSDFK